jgi:hypothetical protein
MFRITTAWTRLCATAGVLAAVGLTSVCHANGRAPDPAVIVEWNEILESVLPPSGLASPRNYAMLHIAMFDAINSIDRSYHPYRVRIAAWPAASQEAAAAQAARDVLAANFPASVATFDAALQARLAGIHPPLAAQGVRVGKTVAAHVLAWRQTDGWNVAPAPYSLPAFPGLYQPTPPAFGAPQFRQFQTTEPFALLTPTQYQPVGPPTLTSQEYADALNQVQGVGSATSTTRTAEQTQLARLFASVISRTIHWGLWNHVARDTARARKLSLIETARLFALLNVSIHDGLQTSHSSKYVHGLWRPVTAIRRADEDLNDQTVADPGWTPLLTTPGYPSHAGNMACVGASAAAALTLFHGTDEIPFTAVWLGNTGNPVVTRPYASFWQMAVDQANSRIYGGIHFSFENLASQEACPKVARYVFENYTQSRDKWRD